MQLLLCAATEFEIGPVIEFIRKNKLSNVEVLITGIGLTAATYSLTRSVIQKRPDFILQAGIAGCIDLGLPLTKIVIVESETIGDLGVEEGKQFRTLFNMGFLEPDRFPWTGGKLTNNVERFRNTGLTLVQGVTVNEISTNAERINYYRLFGAQVESMEGAALHYVALMEKIPFLQMRSLSNFVGERDKTKWVMAQAIATLNHEVERVLNKFLEL
jgi:futalosine hydrolase